ncbi:MAG: hypothetical protein J6S49_01620 [Erysipelotrichaceae bacterium]|nr:hypothetical protein [Erysipelotrichaceae bacterium]
MKITNFSPLIISPKTDELIALFNDLGFEQDHQKSNIVDGKVTSTILKNEDGFIVNIATAPVPRDMTVIRMNVDDIEETIAFLSARGFTNASGEGKIEDTGTSKAALMISPTGFGLSLTQHTK